MYVNERPVKILLVDDRPENLVALEAALEGVGEELVLASSGTEALRHLLNEAAVMVVCPSKSIEAEPSLTAVILAAGQGSRM